MRVFRAKMPPLLITRATARLIPRRALHAKTVDAVARFPIANSALMQQVQRLQIFPNSSKAFVDMCVVFEFLSCSYCTQRLRRPMKDDPEVILIKFNQLSSQFSDGWLCCQGSLCCRLFLSGLLPPDVLRLFLLENFDQGTRLVCSYKPDPIVCRRGHRLAVVDPP
jgi:hypothetical protein